MVTSAKPESPESFSQEPEHSFNHCECRILFGGFPGTVLIGIGSKISSQPSHIVLQQFGVEPSVEEPGLSFERTKMRCHIAMEEYLRKKICK